MENLTNLTEYRFFTPADFREEQAYLELRHKQGWAFSSVHNFKYTFSKTLPSTYTYVRDFKEEDIFIDDYTSMYEDDGWDFVVRIDDSYYFRKKELEFPEEREVFSTDFDRAQYFKRLQMGYMSDTFAFLLVAMFWNVATIIAGCYSFGNFVDVLAVGFGLIFLFLTVVILTMLYMKYRRLDDIELSGAEEQEKSEEEEEEKKEKGEIPTPIAPGEYSELGEFPASKYSFDEVLNAHIKL